MERQDRILLFAYATLLYAVASFFSSLAVLIGVLVLINTGSNGLLVFGSIAQVVLFVLWIAITIYVMAKNA